MIVRSTVADIAVAPAKCLGGPLTNAAGGSSATKRRASLVAMNFAVDGWRARRSMTFMPSSMPPPAGMRVPRTVLAPWSCRRGSK